MSDKLVSIADDFWSIRGSFRILGFLDIGTQASLVKLGSGRFVFVSSYTLRGPLRDQVMNLTDNGAAVDAILNVHPFHTIHCEAMHADFPDAKLFGTERHVELYPDLPWQDVCTEDEEIRAMFADDLEFSVPRGVDFISSNEKLHFGSVLVYHRSSRTIHSDDTLMYLRLPALMRLFGIGGEVSFHPTLAPVLEKRAGAASEFRRWATELAANWQDAENLCAAHNAVLLAADLRGRSLSDRILEALDEVSGKLDAHERKFG